MYQIIVAGLSHKTAPLEIREEFTIQDDQYESVLSDLNSRENILESLVLSTCNRTEFYVVTNDYENCINEINDSLLNFHNIEEKIIKNHFYIYSNEKAVNHLLRVTSSLDSMVVGEPQILGQVKNSYNLSTKNDSAGIILNRLFQYAFFVAKKVRSKTSIGSLSVSISYLAVELTLVGSDQFLIRINAWLDVPGARPFNAGAGRIDRLSPLLYVAAGKAVLPAVHA